MLREAPDTHQVLEAAHDMVRVGRSTERQLPQIPASGPLSCFLCATVTVSILMWSHKAVLQIQCFYPKNDFPKLLSVLIYLLTSCFTLLLSVTFKSQGLFLLCWPDQQKKQALLFFFLFPFSYLHMNSFSRRKCVHQISRH